MNVVFSFIISKRIERHAIETSALTTKLKAEICKVITRGQARLSHLPKTLDRLRGHRDLKLSPNELSFRFAVVG
jgi:hypothetical protein